MDESQGRESWRTESRSYEVDLKIFSRDALFRACYQFTERCYLFLHSDIESSVVVDFRRRRLDTDLEELVGSFANELVAQQLRVDIARETKTIRELIVARAFADAQFEASSNGSQT
jgi:His-Xaa-Ser system protein HxsD